MFNISFINFVSVWEFKISEGQKPNRPPRSYIGLIIDVLDSVPVSQNTRFFFVNSLFLNLIVAGFRIGFVLKSERAFRRKTYRIKIKPNNILQNCSNLTFIMKCTGQPYLDITCKISKTVYFDS